MRVRRWRSPKGGHFRRLFASHASFGSHLGCALWHIARDRSERCFDFGDDSYSVGVSAGARARDRVVATRVRDPSGSRNPPSQQRRSMPSTTALDQSSLEFSEKSCLDQSEFEDEKRLFSGWSGFSVISTSEPVLHFPLMLPLKRDHWFHKGPRDLVLGADNRGGSPAIPEQVGQ